MGCDIHATIERRVSYGSTYHQWLAAGDPNLGRDYELFAILAGVRNYDDIPTICEPKGMPGATVGAGGISWNWTGNEPHDAFREYYEQWYPDAHSATWLTLAELKAFDIDQEIEDSSLVLARDKRGRPTTTCRWTSGSHEGPVGRRKLLCLFSEKPETWLRLLDCMERAKWEDQSDEEVRLVCFFDN